MKKSLVSIAIPYYKSGLNLLKKSINSCLEQTYKNIEIIVLNDGSPDNVDDIVANIKDKRVRYEKSDKNLGVSAERNRAIKLARGEFLLFVDADDWVEPDMVEKMVAAMDSADIVICGLEDDVFDCEDGLFSNRQFFSHPSRFCHLQYTNFTPNKLFRLSIIRKNGVYFNEQIKLGEDALFCQEYFKHTKNIRCLPNKFYHYIRHEQSATKKYDESFYSYEFLVIQAILTNFHKYKLSEDEERYLRYWFFSKMYIILEYYVLHMERAQLDKKGVLKKYKVIFKKFKLPRMARQWKRDKNVGRRHQLKLKIIATSPRLAFRYFARRKDI